MDYNRFDDLTRALAQGTSRRQALKLLGGGIAGAMFAAFGRNTAHADPPFQRTFCRDTCKDTSAKNRGTCMSTCMSCKLETSSLCILSGADNFAIVCCPGQNCTAGDNRAFCT